MTVLLLLISETENVKKRGKEREGRVPKGNCIVND